MRRPMERRWRDSSTIRVQGQSSFKPSLTAACEAAHGMVEKSLLVKHVTRSRQVSREGMYVYRANITHDAHRRSGGEEELSYHHPSSSPP